MSTFNDDLSADMNDPEFAAEFERTTDDVRRERFDYKDQRHRALKRAHIALAEVNASLRSDLLDSADALDESAQLLEDALDENTRLREKAQFFADAWERATRADFEKAQENERLRAELEQLKKAAKIVTENRWFERIGSAESTISRVRAVLDTADVSDRETGFFQDVRDALDGEN